MYNDDLSFCLQVKLPLFLLFNKMFQCTVNSFKNNKYGNVANMYTITFSYLRKSVSYPLTQLKVTNELYNLYLNWFLFNDDDETRVIIRYLVSLVAETSHIDQFDSIN